VIVRNETLPKTERRSRVPAILRARSSGIIGRDVLIQIGYRTAGPRFALAISCIYPRMCEPSVIPSRMKIDGLDGIRIIASGSKSCRFPDDPRVTTELVDSSVELLLLRASIFARVAFCNVRANRTTTTKTKTPENISSVFSAYRIRGLLYLTSNKRSRRTSSAFRRTARRVMRRPITNVRPTNIKDLLLDSLVLSPSRV